MLYSNWLFFDLKYLFCLYMYILKTLNFFLYIIWFSIEIYFFTQHRFSSENIHRCTFLYTRPKCILSYTYRYIPQRLDSISNRFMRVSKHIIFNSWRDRVHDLASVVFSEDQLFFAGNKIENNVCLLQKTANEKGFLF